MTDPIPDEFKEDVDKLRLWIRLASKHVYIDYSRVTVWGNGTIKWGKESPRKWRLKWYDTEQDAYNGFNSHLASYATFAALRKKVMKLIELA